MREEIHVFYRYYDIPTIYTSDIGYEPYVIQLVYKIGHADDLRIDANSYNHYFFTPKQKLESLEIVKSADKKIMSDLDGRYTEATENNRSKLRHMQELNIIDTYKHGQITVYDDTTFKFGWWTMWPTNIPYTDMLITQTMIERIMRHSFMNKDKQMVDSFIKLLGKRRENNDLREIKTMLQPRFEAMTD